MENSALDKIFQEGLSVEEIQSSSVFTGEERQWKIVKNRLSSKMKYLVRLRLFLILGIVSMASVYFLLGLSPKVDGFDNEGGGSDFSSMKSTVGLGNTAVNSEPKEAWIGADKIEESKEQQEAKSFQNTNLSSELSRPEKTNSALSMAKSISNTNPTQINGTDSYTNAVNNKQTSTSNSEESNIVNSSNYGDYYIPEKGDLNVNNSDGSMSESESAMLSRTPFNIEGLYSLDLSVFPLLDDHKFAYYKETEITPAILEYRTNPKFVSIHAGPEYPINFLGSILDNSGFAYTGGLNIKVHRKWFVGLDYTYQNINRQTSESPNTYNLPFKSDIYGSEDPISTNIEYASHALRPNIYYELINLERWNVLGGIGVEIINRSMATGSYTYEGIYQPETETFDFEKKWIASQNVSTSLMMNYKLYNGLYLSSRYRYVSAFGQGINWKLNHRVFIGLSYKI